MREDPDHRQFFFTMKFGSIYTKNDEKFSYSVSNLSYYFQHLASFDSHKKRHSIFFFVFLVIFLPKLFSSWPILLWLSNMLKFYYFFVQIFRSHAEKKRHPFEKTILYFFKTVVGTFYATCTVTGYPSLIMQKLLVMVGLEQRSCWLKSMRITKSQVLLTN